MVSTELYTVLGVPLALLLTVDAMDRAEGHFTTDKHHEIAVTI